MNTKGATVLALIMFLNRITCSLAQGKTDASEFDIRLSYGNTPYEGVVEIFVNNEWTSICDDSMDFKTANVLCRMLGHSSAISWHCCGEFGTGYSYNVIDSVRCEGHEKSIRECHYLVKEHYYDESMMSISFCGHEEDVGLTCNPAEVRLKGGSYGSTMQDGKVEILQDQVWSAIYVEAMDFNLAILLCRMLNYHTAKSYHGHELAHHHDEIINGSFRCSGEEIHFNDCIFSDVGISHTGNKRRVAWLTCISMQIRLRTSSKREKGVVQVFHDNSWGRVCFNSWGMNEANVVCRMLGYEGALEALRDEGNSALAVLEWAQCNGTETNLAHCNLSEFDTRVKCRETGFAAATCIGETSTPLRLAGGRDRSEGRVEVFKYGSWGTVCITSLDFTRLNEYAVNDAHVICRMLGYPQAEGFHCCGYFGPGVGGVYLGLPSCGVKDTDIMSCPELYEQDDIRGMCNHFHDFGVTCQKIFDLEVRLVGGRNRNEGRVEVLYEATWGTICDDNWDLNDANVVCRMLGYERAESYSCCSAFGEGAGDIIFDDVECNGSEVNIGHCPRNKLLSHDCTHAEDVGVTCFGSSLKSGFTTTPKTDVTIPVNLGENERTNAQIWHLSSDKTLGLMITLLMLFVIVNISIAVLSFKIHFYRRRNGNIS